MGNSKKRAPSDLFDQLLPRLSALIPHHARAALALSGGMDSVVMLDLLKRAQAQLHFSLTAIHINHHISPHADQWQAFCAELCAAYAVPFVAKQVHLPQRAAAGVEGAARTLRYQALSEVQSDVLVLAHHLDDQAETLLLNLLRGSGLAGAAAMPLAGGKLAHLLRPLLDVPRSQLLTYAKARQLRWIEDESNQDIAYARNFLRHEIFPSLEKRYPAYRLTLSRAAQHFAEADVLLDELARQDAQSAVRADKLDLRVLESLSLLRAKNLLRFYLAQQGVPPLSHDRLQEGLRQLLAAPNDSRVRLDLAGVALRRYRSLAWVVSDLPLPQLSWQAVWQGETEWHLEPLGGCLRLTPAIGLGISLAKIQPVEIVARLRRGGEKLKPACSRPTRGLKQLFQESGIPPWQRERLPLLFCGQNLVAVPGLGIACEYQAAPGESSLQIEWLGLH